MDRRRFIGDLAYGILGTSLIGSGPLASLARAEGGAARPNVVVILADDMGFSDVGCYGGEIHTPSIDRLAAGGVRFTHFYNTARCSPSRASLLTGLYPHQTGIGHLATTKRDHPSYRGTLNDRCVTMAEALGNAGYRTMMSGKWHLGTNRESWPNNRGFHRSYGEHSYVDEYFKPQFQLYLDGEPVEPEGEDWYSTDVYTDYALRFLDEASGRDEPFFLYMAHNAPHFPLQAFEEDIAKYRGKYMEGWDVLRERRHARMKEMGIVDEGWKLSPRDSQAPAWEAAGDKETWDLKMATYAAQVDRMDQNIGRLLAKLEAMGVAENTLVLFLSDNGGCAETFIDRRNPEGAKAGDRNAKLAYGPPWANLSDTPFRLFKRWVHEGGIATPLIAYWPAVIKDGGRITDQPGHLIDILPTALEAAGAPYPEGYAGRSVHPVEGLSLMPVLRGGTREGHEQIGWEHEGNRAIRMGDWKLVADGRGNDGVWELYNLKEDRTELNDLSGRDPARVAEMKAAYERFAERTGVVPWEQIARRRNT